MASPMLKAALEYLERGWSVIPVVPQGKRPAIPWTAYQNRLPTEDEVRRWWAEIPNANVGIVTGKVSGIVVVDIDTYRGGDVQKVFQKYPTSLVAKTGSGGYHLVFKYPSDQSYVPNQVGEDGVDIRADGGLIVAAPSVHASGNLYEWYSDGEPGDTPYKLLSSGKKSSSPDEGKNWLTTLLAGMGEGGRNDAAARIAGYLAKMQIPQDVAQGFLRAWNHRNNPPLPDMEVTRTVASVFSKAEMQTQAAAKLQSKKALMSLRDYMVAYGDKSEQRWLVKDWMPEGTIAFAVSPPGCYKTWLLLDLCVSIATGEPFLGTAPVEKTGPAVIIQQEDDFVDTADRLSTIIGAKFGWNPHMVGEDGDSELPMPPDIPIYLYTGRDLRFDTNGPDLLEKILEKIKPAIVVIDPLYSALPITDYMAKGAEYMFPLKFMRDKYGTTFVLAHHRKKSAEGTDRMGLWGSQFLNAFLETGWQISKEDEQEPIINVFRHFKSGSPKPVIEVELDINSESSPRVFKAVVNAPGSGGSKKKDVKDPENLLEQVKFVLSEGDWMTKTVVAAKSRGSSASVGKILSHLIEDGEVEINKNVRPHQYRLITAEF